MWRTIRVSDSRVKHKVVTKIKIGAAIFLNNAINPNGHNKTVSAVRTSSEIFVDGHRVGLLPIWKISFASGPVINVIRSMVWCDSLTNLSECCQLGVHNSHRVLTFVKKTCIPWSLFRIFSWKRWSSSILIHNQNGDDRNFTVFTKSYTFSFSENENQLSTQSAMKKTFK